MERFMRKLWIDNQPVSGSDGIRAVIDPATEDVVGEVSWGTVEDAYRVVAAAKKAFPGWRLVPGWQRAGLLHEIARRLRHDLVVSIENPKGDCRL
jgi:aldehyde dehydrogenase (NAD+)